MLSVARVGVRQGRSYYQQDNYYTKDHAIENSEWQGVGAHLLGLSGRVMPQDFEKILEGLAPRNGEKLNSSHDNASNARRAGIDLTLSAPKSVSLAVLIDQRLELEHAHKIAVERTLSFVEERYSLARTGRKEERQVEAAGNLVVAKFHHDTSREHDPQLHTHCVVLNAVKRHDGKWRSLHNDGMFSNSKLIGLVYQNELAREVQKLGYVIERKSNGTFELSGYTEEQLRSFSKRTQKIEALGCDNKKEERKKKLKHRPTKGKEMNRESLKAAWLAEAKELSIAHPLRQKSSSQENPPVHTHEVAESAMRHASEKDVQFRQEVLEKFALESHLGVLNFRSFEREIGASLRKGDLIRVENNKLTTEAALATERRMLSALEQGKDRFVPIAQNIEKQLSQLPFTLNQGQAAAVRTTLESRDQFTAWQGVAGAGKTFAMNVVRELASEKEIPLRGFAPSAEAAKVLEQESRIESQTVASLLATSPLRTNHRKGEIWIIDEAGLLSARDCERLMQRAQIAEARVVFVGDTRQLSAVEAGNPFRLLQQHGISTAHLTESRRQKNEALKASVDLMAQGKQKEALQGISAQIVELKRESTRARFITNEYMKLPHSQRESTLVLAGTNAERELLTESIRSALKHENSLGATAKVTILQARELSREELGDAAKLAVGDVLVFHKDRKRIGIEKSAQFEIVATNSKMGLVCLKSDDGREISITPKHYRDAFLAYEKREIEVAIGERLRWTKNDKALGVRNGQECILETHENGNLKLKHRNGKILEISSSDLLHLEHNYVNTVFSSQGKTCDQSIISVDQTFGKEAMYVAISRARNSMKIVTPDKDEMLKIVTQSKAKLSALDLLPEEKLAVDLRHSLRMNAEESAQQHSKKEHNHTPKRGHKH